MVKNRKSDRKRGYNRRLQEVTFLLVLERKRYYDRVIFYDFLKFGCFFYVMEEVLRLYREATGHVYDGNLYNYTEYGPDDDLGEDRPSTSSRSSNVDLDLGRPGPSGEPSIGARAIVDRPRSRSSVREDGSDAESDVDDDVVGGGIDSDESGASDDDNDIGGDDTETESIQWTDQLEEVRVNEFVQDVGPRHNLPVGSQPIDYFHLLLPHEQFERIADQTNLYARQCQAIKRKEDKQWKEVTAGDIKVWVAINIMFGIHQLPQYDMYWSSDDRLRVPGVADVMSKTRYEKISQYLHVNNNENAIPKGQPGHDPLFKVRPLLNLVLEKIPEHFKPGREISVDEAMIPFTGRLSFKQYIRGKPNPWGIKAWSAADAATGYLLKFDIYTGRSAQVLPNGSGYHVVTSIVRRYLHQWYHVYYDNYFSSMKLASDLLKQSTYSCGTIRPNRKGWPYALKPAATKSLKKGEVKALQSGSMVATVWRDKRYVNILSTNTSSGMTTVTRNTPRGRADTLIPTAVHKYNNGMGGVDRFDQHCSYYDFGRKSRKWWRYLFRFLFQVVIINSWIIFRESHHPHPKGQKNLNQVFFRLDLVTALTQGNVRKGRNMQPQTPATIGGATLNRMQHEHIRMSGRKLACHYCSKTKNYGNRGRAPETVFGCNLCKVRLCKGACFGKFHDEL